MHRCRIRSSRLLGLFGSTVTVGSKLLGLLLFLLLQNPGGLLLESLLELRSVTELEQELKTISTAPPVGPR